VTDTYVHGYSAREQARLARMQTLLNERQLAAMRLDGVRSLLDVGCGLAQLTREMARTLPAGSRVVGVEREPIQLAEAARLAAVDGEERLVELRQGAAESLPLAADERGSFDLAHARFLLEHVPNPLAVVREMVAAVRPGGRVVLVDDDHDTLRLWPDCPRFERVWRIYWQSYRDDGHDPLVGRRLPELLDVGGATPVRVTSVFYGAVSGEPLFEGVVDNLAGVVGGAGEALAARRRLTCAEMTDALTALAEWRQEPAATLWYSLPLAEGVRPG
jgi:SAM-dependent methyltransferase